MPLHSVGSPYHPTRTQWPECAQYNFRGGEHELVMFFASPSRHEVEAVSKGECEFALYVEQPLVVLCYRFGIARGIPWSDAPYSWHLVKAHDPSEATLPIHWEEGSPETRALLLCFLVDAQTGILRAMRQVTLSPPFTRALHKAIWEQAHHPFEARTYQAAIDSLYDRWPTTNELVEHAQHRTKGGA